MSVYRKRPALMCLLQMNYARFFYKEYFPDLHGTALHIDDDCIVQGKTLVICRAMCLVKSVDLFNVYTCV